MEHADYLELQGLQNNAGQALMSGELNDWQHALTSTFHLLSQFILAQHNEILELKNRVGGSEPPSDQPAESRIILGEK